MGIKIHRGIAYERFTNHGPIALLPLPNRAVPEYQHPHHAALVWTHPNTSSTTFKSLSDAELVDRLHLEFGFRAGAIHAMGKRQIYPLRLVQATEQVRSHLVILGNAAHSLHPVAGQGFNLALRDCHMLVTCLIKAQQKNSQPLGALSNLNTYQTSQVVDQYRTIELTDGFVKLFSNKHPAHIVLRQLGLAALHTITPLRQCFAKSMMGLL